MDFAFTEEQQALKRAARSFLAAHATKAAVRRAMASSLGYDPELWKRMAGELGWAALVVPEDYGGAGLSHVELAAVMEEMGRSLVCAPFFSTVCLFGNAVLESGNSEQKARLFSGVISGDTLGALAHAESSGSWDAGSIQATARASGDEYVLNGRKSFVVDGHIADTLLVAVRVAGSSGRDGISLFLVDARAPGLTRKLLPTLDQTRKLAELTLSQVRVPKSALLGDEGEGIGGLERALDLACVALAAEQVGGAEKCLELAVDYAKTRVQFGRPIGSFQAIKHKCADMFVRIESARSACYYAAWVAATASQGFQMAASQAKAYCSEAFLFAAAENLQIHGGVGFTWEHDAHLYFKRAKSSEMLFGDPQSHRERYACALGL